MNQVLVGAGGCTVEEVLVERGTAGPVRFWRGQGRYEVGQLVEHRAEVDRQVWRVEAVRAGRSRTTFAGVFDLAWEPFDDRWTLVRVHD
ncbi:hypothetical protein TEK04_04755 [Klenkia sp. LSe6-5]|uniref:DUF2914 domain-containing protein n=1 Tax=Klenkia sesuvii TaxID=3103137 RepID=A0ABU8DSM0_9ACTN